MKKKSFSFLIRKARTARLNQSGQTLMEFLLLLAGVYLMAIGMLKVTNQGISKIWVGAANIVIHPYDRYNLNDLR